MNGSGVHSFCKHLKGFADSNDAIQSTAVETEDTVSTTNRDFLLVHVYLKKKNKEEKGELLDECYEKTVTLKTFKNQDGSK